MQTAVRNKRADRAAVVTAASAQCIIKAAFNLFTREVIGNGKFRIREAAPVGVLLAVAVIAVLLSASAPTSEGAQAIVDTMQQGAKFRVEIDGMPLGTFKKVDGLSAKTEIIEHKEAGDGTVRKQPGETSWSNIVLTREVSGRSELWAWYEHVIQGEPERRNGAVIFYNAAGREIVRYNFVNAFPVTWTGPAVNTSDSGRAEEKIEIAHEGLTLAYP